MFQWFLPTIFLFIFEGWIFSFLLLFFIFYNEFFHFWKINMWSNSIEISVMMILTIMVFVMIEHCYSDVSSFSISGFLMCWFSIIFFCSSSILLMFLIVESMIIPVIFTVFVEGNQPEKIKALFNFLMYTIYSGFPMFFVILEIFSSSFFDFFSEISLPLTSVFLILSFLSKLPIFILHLWLPKLHSEAPTQGSIILAGLLLKLGGFGINMCLLALNTFYFFLFFFPAFLGVVLCVFLVFLQSDIKAFVAFSSITHMNMGLLVVIFLTNFGKLSSYMLMITHGVVASLMFFSVSLSYYFGNTRLLYYSKGVSFIFFLIFFCILLVNFSVPPFCAFIQEYFLIGVLFSSSKMMFFVLLVYMFMVACYNLSLALSFIPSNNISQNSDIILMFFFILFCLNYFLLFFMF